MSGSPSPGPSRWIRASTGWPVSVGLGVVVLGVYLANGREIGQYDTEPTTLTAYLLARGEGIALDRFGPFLREPDGRLLASVGRSGGHLISRYPLAPAILAAPLVAVQAAYRDWTAPGWDAHPLLAWREARRFAKRAAAILAALAVVAIHRLLVRLGFARGAIPATLAVALGSDLWTVGSQALWQHGPAALMLALALLALSADRPSRPGFFLGGLAAALLVACRAIDLVFAVALLAWVAASHARRLGLFLVAPIVVGTALVVYNMSVFNALSGGQASLEAMHPEIHGVPGPWSGSIGPGMAGTLFSPARGLLVYSPWLLLALLIAPASLRLLARRSVVSWALAALVVYLLVLSKYAVWWAGHTFGPRYWTDAVPLLAVILAAGLEWSRQNARPLRIAFALLIAVSVATQAIGAFYFPSSWNLHPANVDRAHNRLWDWKDTEISRCLKEGPRGP